MRRRPTSDFGPLTSVLRRPERLPGVRILHLRAARKTAHIDVTGLRRVRARDEAGLVWNWDGVGNIALRILILRWGRRWTNRRLACCRGRRWGRWSDWRRRGRIIGRRLLRALCFRALWRRRLRFRLLPRMRNGIPQRLKKVPERTGPCWNWRNTNRRDRQPEHDLNSYAEHREWLSVMQGAPAFNHPGLRRIFSVKENQSDAANPHPKPGPPQSRRSLGRT